MTTLTENRADLLVEGIEPNRELISRAAALRELIREHAEAGSDAGRVEPVVMDALRDAGLLKLTVPQRFGGYETNSRTFVEVLSELAQGDGSTAWSAMLLNIGNWFATTWCGRAQEEIWGDDPDAACCVILASGVVGERVDGGYRITGGWPYASGSFAATHAIVGFLVEGPDGKPAPALGILQPGEWTVERTWVPIGLKGTGSDTVRADGIVIPDHRIQLMLDLVEGQYATEFAPLEARSRAPFLATGTIIFGAVQIGLGKAVLEQIIDRVRNKGVVGTAYTVAANSPSHQITIARAASMIDAAEQLAFRSCRDIDQSAIDGDYPSLLLRARIRNDTGAIIELVNDAIDKLMKAGGSSTFLKTSPLHRIFQDSFVGGSHVHATPGVANDVYGKLLLGHTEDLPIHV